MPLSNSFTDAYHQLTKAWASHQDMRKTGVSIDKLYESRVALEAARARVASLR